MAKMTTHRKKGNKMKSSDGTFQKSGKTYPVERSATFKGKKAPLGAHHTFSGASKTKR